MHRIKDLLRPTPLSLKEHCSIGVGGPATRVIECSQRPDIARAAAFLNDQPQSWMVLGGGTNLVFSDAGYEGFLVRLKECALKVVAQNSQEVLIEVDAGMDWDALVAHTVAHSWMGLECLSGIPGQVGAAPIQNIGAYGCEIAQVIDAVQVFDSQAGCFAEWAPQQCHFSYRHSIFKERGDLIVCGLRLRLRRQGRQSIEYPELMRAYSEQIDHHAQDYNARDISAIRDCVLRLRRQKSMVLDTNDPMSKSCGSFFMNPILTATAWQQLSQRLNNLGFEDPPNYPMPDGHIKVPAAYLIEKAGFAKGTRHGGAGISQKHALALVNYQGASAQEIFELCDQIKSGVQQRLGVTLNAEATLIDR